MVSASADSGRPLSRPKASVSRRPKATASVLVTARLIRPLRGLFVTHQARDNAGLVGSNCRITSLRVDERHGQAEVAQRGASLLIQVWADTPNQLTKGDAAVILEYDAGRGRYLIQAAEHTSGTSL